MSGPRVLVMSRAILRMLRPPPDEFDYICLDDHADRDAFLARDGAGITAILCSGMERLDAARLALLPDLRLIAVVAAGMAGIDFDAARTRGIAVCNAGDINAGDVAEYAVTMMLAHRRAVIANDAYVRSGRWVEARLPPGHAVSAQRVGIVGLGHIGRNIAQRLAPFGCAIRWWGPNPKPVCWQRIDSLADLADWATTLMVAVAGNDDTRGLVSADILGRLGPDGLIVNVSRGFVIEEPAMIAALRDGTLGGAALDVFDREPIDGSGWVDVPNVLMAPHVAGATVESLAAVMQGALDNVRRHFAGQPLERRVV